MIADATVVRYRRIFEMLCGDAGSPTDVGSARRLGASLRARDIAKASRTLYAASVRYCLGEEVLVIAFNEGLADAELPRPRSRGADRRRQSITLPEGMFEAVIGVLEDNTKSWSLARPLIMMILGMRHFGLRPVEWESCHWKDASCSSLIVTNAKFADTVIERGPQSGKAWRRANGVSRELVIIANPVEQFIRIASDAMSAARVAPYSDDSIGRGYRRTHKLALKEVEKLRLFRADILRSITIYSYRHMFASAIKASADVPTGEVAALMGHISTNTAIQSYARASRRASFVAVAPSQLSIDSVSVRNARLIHSIADRETVAGPSTAIAAKASLETNTNRVIEDEPSGPSR